MGTAVRIFIIKRNVVVQYFALTIQGDEIEELVTLTTL